METLTAKQIANRAYYAKNAEKITAKKRSQYTTRKTAKPAKARKTKPEPVTIKPDWQATAPAKSKASKITAEESSRLKARRRIEDILMARELGLDDFDL